MENDSNLAKNYLSDGDGKIIAASQRPDGTWRKARRVKEGYVPQEEVPLYESKGKQFAQRKTGLPPGMCPNVAEASKKEREKQERAKAKKHEKKSTAATKQKQQTPGVLVLPATASDATSAAKPTTAPKRQLNAAATTTHSAVDTLSEHLLATLQLDQDDDPQEIVKKLKKLRKKLREIESIEEKIKSGELKKPEKDQLDKVKRKKEVLRDIKRLQEAEVAV